MDKNYVQCSYATVACNGPDSAMHMPSNEFSKSADDTDEELKRKFKSGMSDRINWLTKCLNN